MLSLKVEGADVVIANLAAIKSPNLRKKIFNQAARQLIKSAKERIRQQVDLDGKPFGDYSLKTNHSRPRRRGRKMLARIVKNLSVSDLNDFGVTVGWRNSFESTIAGKQQFGFKQVFKKSYLSVELDGSRKERDYYQLQATRRQAKALLDAGYKVKSKGKALKTPSIKWITQNLTIAKAGLILRVLRGSKDQWETNLPARSFLGISNEDLQLLVDVISQEIEKTFKTGASAWLTYSI